LEKLNIKEKKLKKYVVITVDINDYDLINEIIEDQKVIEKEKDFILFLKENINHKEYKEGEFLLSLFNKFVKEKFPNLSNDEFNNKVDELHDETNIALPYEAHTLVDVKFIRGEEIETI
jgi:hypothetical protein